jgi:hypothetical protein
VIVKGKNLRKPYTVRFQVDGRQIMLKMANITE